MTDTKRQDLPIGLWIVATPIGNLADLSQRALEALRRADFILCEDTRRTSALLSATGILNGQERLSRYDAHTKVKQIEAWVEQLQKGFCLALVSDAGTPSISDPGASLVSYAVQAGIRVVPIPGPSAVVSLLSVSGFQSQSFTFRGFFPRENVDRANELAITSKAQSSEVFLWYESPHRIAETLALFETRWPEAKAVAGKELTKFHERIFHGTVSELNAQIQAELRAEGELGEWCFAVQFPHASTPEASLEEQPWFKAIECLLEADVSIKTAAKVVSHHFGIAKNSAYEAALRKSGKKREDGA